jgi:uncharacterized protein (DUF1501 family)
MNPGRRRALGRLGALSAGSLFSRLWMGDAIAAPASGYQALVCVFLYGGNDANNMLIPITTNVANSNYANYLSARQPQSNGGVALPQNTLLPITDSRTQETYGLHPSLAALQPLYTQTNPVLAFQMNMGTLIEPITMSIYNSNASANRAKVPVNLYSHSDQQNQQAASSILDLSNGWGGRIADQLGAVGGVAPVGISIAGNALFLKGARTSQVAVYSNGGLNVNGVFGTTVGEAQFQALLAASGNGSTMISTLAGIQSNSITLSKVLNPILSGTAPSSVSSAFSPFSTGNSGFSQQLQAVARIIGSTALGSPTRQIFFVSLGSFDTHNSQIEQQGPLLQQLSEGMAAFYQATVNLNVASQVTTFTLSDFARTLKPASGDGTDHAWGSHHMILGGAVKGGTNYGTFPSLALGGPDDTSNEGRWLPTTSLDQYGATLGAWMGLNAAQLATVFPNLKNFSQTNVGFV